MSLQKFLEKCILLKRATCGVKKFFYAKILYFNCVYSTNFSEEPFYFILSFNYIDVCAWGVAASVTSGPNLNSIIILKS